MPQDPTSLLLSSIQVASNGWVAFDYATKRKQWEATLQQTKEARDNSVAARKQLTDITKKFKTSVKTLEQQQGGSNAEFSKDCRVTIKAYQEAIDKLTRRCKASENAYSSVTQALMEIPDPAAVLSAAVEQLNVQSKQLEKLQKTADDQGRELQQVKQQAAAAASNAAANTSSSGGNGGGGGASKQEKEELIQLRREVAEYEVEFRSLKNQDITIRKLEAQIVAMQESGEVEMEEKLEKAKQELVETEGRRALEALEREAAMERKVHSLELQLKAEIAGRAATQAHLLEADEGAGEREAAWEAQRKILVDDAESLRLRLHEASRERDELRLKVAATGRSPSSGGISTRGLASAPPSGSGIGMADLLNERKAYEAEVSELSHTANSLREELRLKDEQLHEETRTLQARIDELQQKEATLNSNLASLESQLAAAPSQSVLDSMKRELRILKRLEYNAEDFDVDANDNHDDPEMTGRNESDEQDLETVLVAKLRRIEADLVKERNQKTDVEKDLDAHKEQLQKLQDKQMETDQLIATLEADLDRATSSQNASDGKSSSKKSSSSSPSTAAPPVTVDSDGAILQSVLDPTAPPPPPSAKESRSTSASSKSSAEKAQDDHSVATIIMAQRDRLRVRCDALEAERDSFKRELQAQVQASESLKADNTKLFEKMRYLQSYNGASSGAVSVRGNRSMSKDRDLDLEALEQRYEASVDPFRQFSRSERQRKLQEMSAMERSVFIVAKTFLGSKEMRTFLFFYILAMHMLVFLTTYHWSHRDESSACTLHQEMLSHLPPDMSKQDMLAELAKK